MITFKEYITEACTCALNTSELQDYLRGEFPALRQESRELDNGINSFAKEEDGYYKYETAKPGKKLLKKVLKDFMGTKYYPF